MADSERPGDAMKALLQKLLRVPKAEIDRLEAQRPKKRKRNKPA
jgi:uncharacterized small protein (DUF1192 family)